MLKIKQEKCHIKINKPVFIEYPSSVFASLDVHTPINNNNNSVCVHMRVCVCACVWHINKQNQTYTHKAKINTPDTLNIPHKDASLTSSPIG